MYGLEKSKSRLLNQISSQFKLYVMCLSKTSLVLLKLIEPFDKNAQPCSPKCQDHLPHAGLNFNGHQSSIVRSASEGCCGG